MILERSAEVFNRKGYFGASMADIMEATGLEKGGIYNYFQGKDDLALQAFDYSVDLVRQEFGAAIKGKFHAVQRLDAVFEVFRGLSEGRPLKGGCPILNTAIEADDNHPALRERASQAMQEFHDFVSRIIQRGAERGEILAGTDPEQTASFFYATLEGAVMLTRLSGNPAYIDRAINHLKHYLASTLRA